VPELEVQMGAGAPAGTARRAEALPYGDLLADADAPAGEVRVQRDPAVAERDLHEVPVALEAAALADCDHASRLGRPNSGRAEDPDVDPRVPPAAVVAER